MAEGWEEERREGRKDGERMELVKKGVCFRKEGVNDERSWWMEEGDCL